MRTDTAMSDSERPAGCENAPAGPRQRRVSAADLFGRCREVVIVHGRDEYRLRITKNDKLILTK